jgi:ribosomal protein S6
MQYELFYLVGERQEANLDAIKEEVNGILALEQANLVGEELSEKRKLAYEIKHQKKGTYITRRFELPEIDFWADEANADREFCIQAITNKLNLNNNVLRFLIVKTEDLPDLGAKDRRKAQELTMQKGQGQQRPGQRPGQRQDSRPMRPAPRPAATMAPKVKPQPKPEAAPTETKKEAGKDIDKQLDELLG